ncbi:MAG TPA: trypsin-like peptidase domain-containing protein [Phycisphaerae bacterium]|nr:trypsin-like peptidase domain-containing protein [Phycisphaerae bacterium]
MRAESFGGRIAGRIAAGAVVAALAVGAWAQTTQPASLVPPALSEAQKTRVNPVVTAYRKVQPAVVNISSQKLVQQTFGLFGGSDPFEDVFPSPLRRRVPVQSLGSGAIIHPGGYIVTNAHVVRRADKITVTLQDKTQYEAKVISADPRHDLAVLKVEPKAGHSLPYLPLGRSDDLMPGETVIAIGNPLGYANSLTTGVISALDRTLEFGEDVSYTGLIQTDAPINPGNSGGPLLNIHGEFIGINTAIRADAQNIGFAIPVDALARELPALLDFERINRLIFGAEVAQRHTEAGDMVFVTAVRAGTPAAQLLRTGDRVVQVDDRKVGQIVDYTCGMLDKRADQVVRLTLQRGGKDVAAAVRVKAKPRPNGKELAHRWFGMTLREVTPELARDLRLTVDRGLLVVGLEADGPAHRLGLKLGDVLFQVGQFYTLDLETLGTVLEDVRAGQVARIGIVRHNVRAWANIQAQAAPQTQTAPADAPAKRAKSGQQAR